MAYLTYRADLNKSLRDLKAPTKKLVESLTSINEPSKVFRPAFRLVAMASLTGLKASFFSARKIINR